MYTVPIIAPDLRHEETIIQAACALDCLKMTIDNVFQRLDERIATNTTRIKEIGVRINKAEERIGGLFGVKRAIKIYAPARFPATNVLHDLPITFNMINNDDKEKAQQQQQQELAKILYEVVSGVESPELTEVMKNKLVFFHVRSTVATADAQNMASGMSTADYIANARAKVNRYGHSLGRAPEHLHSTAALLRFNSEEYAYSSCAAAEQSAQAKETWRRAKIYKNQRQSGALQRKQQQLLEPAPHSLSNRHQAARATPSGELRYTPQMHEAPSIDLPLDLPTLEGVAEDIHFMGSTDMTSMQIRPSSANITMTMEQNEKSEEKVQIVVENITASTTIPTVTTPMTKNVIKEVEATPTQIVTAPPAPPAPPLAMTVPPPPPPPLPPVGKSDQQSSTSAGSDTRSALMDAIRKAGGARGGGLRSAAAAPVDVVDTNKKKHDNNNNNSINKIATGSSSSGGDLMADLHNKLLMRRKGISGNNSSISNNSQSGSILENPQRREMCMGNSVIQRLSDLIPPPPTKTKVNQQQQQRQRYDKGKIQQHSDDDDDDDENNANNEDDEDWD